MHHRRGTWVEGHYRNGSWVEGHWRSSTHVDDGYYHQPYEQSKPNPIHSSINYGSITFLTECWWCGDSVYFHRDDNGGCVLFDELGKPWPIHPCWEQNQDEQCFAIQKALEDQSVIIRSQLVPKIYQPERSENDLVVSGCIVSYAQTKEIKLSDSKKSYKVIDLLVLSEGKHFQILVDDKYKSLLLPVSMAKFKCSVRKRGASYLIYSGEVFNYLPENEERIFLSPLKVDTLVSLPWVHTVNTPFLTQRIHRI